VGVAARAASAPQTVAPAHYLKRSAHAGMLKDRRVVFSGRRIVIPVIAVAPGAPDTTFEIHGRVDPTLVFPAGVRIRFALANAYRGMPHGLDVTRKSPPYAKNPDLRATHKASASGGKAVVAATGVIPPARDSHWRARRSAWVTLAPGTYYYACPVPGHARKGMHGRIVVKARHAGEPSPEQHSGTVALR